MHMIFNVFVSLLSLAAVTGQLHILEHIQAFFVERLGLDGSSAHRTLITSTAPRLKALPAKTLFAELTFDRIIQDSKANDTLELIKLLKRHCTQSFFNISLTPSFMFLNTLSLKI